ncbi:hypothetical protein BC826DRAFT_276317 [Russula brevipes]|nr:hypothetical protein BC826DRAFT_276317 [Russula brevipes]
MSPFQPAVRAHQVKPYPVLNVDVQGEDENDSPGAGKTLPYAYGDRLYDEPTRPGSPVQTRISDASRASPTPTTVVQVSTSTVTTVVPDAVSYSSPAFNATLPAGADSPNISPSPSLSPLPPSSPPLSTSTTSKTSSPASTTPPSFVGMTPSTDVLAGSANGKKSSGLSGGAIGGIVTVAVLALCALAFFIFRNRRIQKRVARRVTWTAGLAPRPDFDSSLEKGVGDVQPISSEASISATSQSSTSGANGGGEAQPPVRNIARKPPLPYSPISPTAPPQTYNNPPHPTTPTVHPVAIHSVPSPSPSPSPSAQDVPVVVRVTFVPQLPDELAIAPGETLCIRAEFDDGWALCVNARGKQGMVPLECLDGDVDGPLTGPPRIGDWRSSRRASSLRSVATWS